MKQENRPTPETDAAARVMLDGIASEYIVRADFARKLKRERDEARELARELRDALELMTYGLLDVSETAMIYGRDAKRIVENAAALVDKAKEVLP